MHQFNVELELNRTTRSTARSSNIHMFTIAILLPPQPTSFIEHIPFHVPDWYYTITIWLPKTIQLCIDSLFRSTNVSVDGILGVVISVIMAAPDVYKVQMSPFVLYFCGR